jgi:hypothetical protein
MSQTANTTSTSNLRYPVGTSNVIYT